MSLASRVTNLFSSGSTNTRGENRNSLGFADDGLSGGDDNLTRIIMGTELVGSGTTMAPEALEDEARPPYLHVSWVLPLV